MFSQQTQPPGKFPARSPRPPPPAPPHPCPHLQPPPSPSWGEIPGPLQIGRDRQFIPVLSRNRSSLEAATEEPCQTALQVFTPLITSSFRGRERKKTRSARSVKKPPCLLIRRDVPESRTWSVPQSPEPAQLIQRLRQACLCPFEMKAMELTGLKGVCAARGGKPPGCGLLRRVLACSHHPGEQTAVPRDPQGHPLGNRVLLRGRGWGAPAWPGYWSVSSRVLCAWNLQSQGLQIPF